MMDGRGKSDSLVVPEKPSNKAGRPVAERVEGRGLAKGNSLEGSACRTQGRESASSALERVRQAARESWRYHPRQEPDAGKPHVRICAGGGS
jgi:RNA-directed DNA polymerase